jgi:hypothetical protein
MKRLYLLAAAVLLASPAVSFAQNCTAITAVPTTITVPGKYCLAKDFTINSATAKAINIATNDVTLDCDGRMLKNLATANAGSSIGIFAQDRNNITIKNCRIIGGFTDGIAVLQNNAVNNKNYYIQIQDNYIAGPYWRGIYALGSAIEVTGNKVYDIGGQLNQYAIGIRVGGSTVASAFKLHVVRNNTVVGTSSQYSGAYGIFSDGTVSGAFTDNGIAGTTPGIGKIGYGLYVAGQHNRISDNHVTGIGAPAEYGVWTTNDTTSCFDNYLRTTNWTLNCDATLGNY